MKSIDINYNGYTVTFCCDAIRHLSDNDTIVIPVFFNQPSGSPRATDLQTSLSNIGINTRFFRSIDGEKQEINDNVIIKMPKEATINIRMMKTTEEELADAREVIAHQEETINKLQADLARVRALYDKLKDIIETDTFPLS